MRKFLGARPNGVRDSGPPRDAELCTFVLAGGARLLSIASPGGEGVYYLAAANGYRGIPHGRRVGTSPGTCARQGAVSMAGRRAVACACGHSYFTGKDRPRCGKCGARGAATETSAEAVHEYQAAQREVEAPPEPEIALIEPEDLLPAVARDQLADEDGDVPAFADPIDGEQPASALDLTSMRADREVIERAAKIQTENAALKRRLAAVEQRAPVARAPVQPSTAVRPLDSPSLASEREGLERLRIERSRLQEEQYLNRLTSGGGQGGGDAEVKALLANMQRQLDTEREARKEEAHRRELAEERARADERIAQTEARWQATFAAQSQTERALQIAQRVGWTPPGAHDAQAASHELLKDGMHGIRKRIDDFSSQLPLLAERLDRKSPIDAALEEQARAQAMYLIQNDPRFAAAVDRAAEQEALRMAQERGESMALVDAEVPEGSPLLLSGDPEALAERLRREAVTHEFAAPPARPRNPAPEDLP